MRASTLRYAVGDGIELVADVAGEAGAPCVVLMHGGGQTRFSWQGAMQELLNVGYRVVNFDARGHGDSGWAGPGGYSLARHAEDLAKVIQEERGPVALVGASLGGATALRAMADGLNPAAVVLVDIVPRPDPKGVQRIRDFMLGNPGGFASVEEVADAIAAYNPHRSRPPESAGLMRNLREGADGRLRWHWDPAFLGRQIAVELAELHDTIQGARAAANVPVLLIRGLDSDVVSQQGMDELKDALPGLEVFDVPNAGHMVAGDRNDVFNQGMIDFLTSHIPAKVAPDRAEKGYRRPW
jgi:pimeloyl-ACP methyl ester carboxylesterase